MNKFRNTECTECTNTRINEQTNTQTHKYMNSPAHNSVTYRKYGAKHSLPGGKFLKSRHPLASGPGSSEIQSPKVKLFQMKNSRHI